MEELLVKPASMPELHRTVDEEESYMSLHVFSAGMRMVLTGLNTWENLPGVAKNDSRSMLKMQKEGRTGLI